MCGRCIHGFRTSWDARIVRVLPVAPEVHDGFGERTLGSFGADVTGTADRGVDAECLGGLAGVQGAGAASKSSPVDRAAPAVPDVAAGRRSPCAESLGHPGKGT